MASACSQRDRVELNINLKVKEKHISVKIGSGKTRKKHIHGETRKCVNGSDYLENLLLANNDESADRRHHVGGPKIKI